MSLRQSAQPYTFSWSRRQETDRKASDSDIAPETSQDIESLEVSKKTERTGNVDENKGSHFQNLERTGNVIENTYSYAHKPGMLLKAKDLMGDLEYPAGARLRDLRDQKNFPTKVTEVLRGLCVEAFKRSKNTETSLLGCGHQAALGYTSTLALTAGEGYRFKSSRDPNTAPKEATAIKATI